MTRVTLSYYKNPNKLGYLTTIEPLFSDMYKERRKMEVGNYFIKSHSYTCFTYLLCNTVSRFSPFPLIQLLILKISGDPRDSKL